MILNNSFIDLTLTPGLSLGPIIVYVLPAPVCPYAIIHTLYPSAHEVMIGLVSSNTFRVNGEE